MRILDFIDNIYSFLFMLSIVATLIFYIAYNIVQGVHNARNKLRKPQ